MMTPRERAEAFVESYVSPEAFIWGEEDTQALTAAITEHVRALLADDEATVELMADRLGSWLRPGLDARYVACAVLAAQRGKALGD
jgi:hypothetical protein